MSVNGGDVGGVRVLYTGVYGVLSMPLTEEGSKALGRGTKWCTAGDKDNRFKTYKVCECCFCTFYVL